MRGVHPPSLFLQKKRNSFEGNIHIFFGKVGNMLLVVIGLSCAVLC